MATDANSGGEEPRFEMLPVELRIQIASNLTSKQDAASLRLTCRRLHNPATEAYVELCQRREFFRGDEVSVLQETLYYHEVAPWKALYISDVFLQLPDSRRANFERLCARQRIGLLERRNPSPEELASEMPQLQRDFREWERKLQTLRQQEIEYAQATRLLALFTKTKRLTLEGLKTDLIRTKLPLHDFRKAVKPFHDRLTDLYLLDCAISSGHLRLLLTTFPKLQRLVLSPCIITDDWTSALIYVHLHSDSLKHLSISSEGIQFITREEVDRGATRAVQRRHGTWQSHQVTTQKLEAIGDIAARHAIERVLRGWMGSEERVKAAIEEAKGDMEREKGWEENWEKRQA